jgi:hypothetical protein
MPLNPYSTLPKLSRGAVIGFVFPWIAARRPDTALRHQHPTREPKDHGVAVMVARNDFSFEGDVHSDCAPLLNLLPLWAMEGTKWMRDITRGGLATVVCEFAEEMGVTVVLEEAQVPFSPPVRAVGRDPRDRAALSPERGQGRCGGECRWRRQGSRLPARSRRLPRGVHCWRRAAQAGRGCRHPQDRLRGSSHSRVAHRRTPAADLLRSLVARVSAPLSRGRSLAGPLGPRRAPAAYARCSGEECRVRSMISCFISGDRSSK